MGPLVPYHKAYSSCRADSDSKQLVNTSDLPIWTQNGAGSSEVSEACQAVKLWAVRGLLNFSRLKSSYHSATDITWYSHVQSEILSSDV